MQEPSGFTIGLVKHPQGRRQPFSELSTKLDDIGLTATDRGELVQWEQHLVAADASPIQDTLLDHHLNFRDPDGIPLELPLPERHSQMRARSSGSGSDLTSARRLVSSSMGCALVELSVLPVRSSSAGSAQ